MFIARSSLAFVITYLLLAVPTYILPYFGSNSSWVNAFSAAMGLGPTPQWWMHVWFLVILTTLSWLRGRVMGKGYLPVFVVLAAIFDMTPGLSLIPAIPSLMHLVTIIVGCTGKAVMAEAAEVEGAISRMRGAGRKAMITATLATVFAVAGSLMFVMTASRSAKAMQRAHDLPVTPTVPPTKVNVQAKAIETVPAARAPAPIAAAQVPSVAISAPLTPARPLAKHSALRSHAHYENDPKPAATVKPQVRYIRIND